jgi:hypothetical protein
MVAIRPPPIKIFFTAIYPAGKHFSSGSTFILPLSTFFVEKGLTGWPK